MRDHPEGMPAISRGLSEAIPPEDGLRSAFGPINDNRWYRPPLAVSTTG